MTTEVEIVDALVRIGQTEMMLAQMAEQHRVNTRRLLAVLDNALAPLLEKYIFEVTNMPNSTQGAVLRMLTGMSMVSVTVLPEDAVVPAVDFSLPTEDVVRWRYHMDHRMGSRFEFVDGVLHVHQYTSMDTYLMHELGHLLSLPPERWWRYNGCGEAGKDEIGRSVLFDFKFKYPTTRQGVEQLCMNEIKANAIEEVLIDRYQLSRRQNDFIANLYAFCNVRFGFLLRAPNGRPITREWIEERCEAERVTFDDIMARWRDMTHEIGMKALIYRTTHTLPPPRT